MVSRVKAFEKDNAEGWTPSRDDEVFLPPRTPFRINARAIVETILACGFVKVRYHFKGHLQERILPIDDLRPTGRRLVLDETLHFSFRPSAGGYPMRCERNGDVRFTPSTRRDADSAPPRICWKVEGIVDDVLEHLGDVAWHNDEDRGYLFEPAAEICFCDEDLASIAEFVAEKNRHAEWTAASASGAK